MRNRVVAAVLAVFADLTNTKGWHTFLDIGAVLVTTGGVGSLLVVLAEVFYSTARNREGRYGEAVGYGFILGATAGAALEGFAKLGVS